MRNRGWFRVAGALALAAVVADGAVAQKTAISDAQVEANVLKTMAADTRLADQPIQSTTAFGTVTLTGAVANETLRDAAEKAASHTEGVKKVVDQLAVGQDAVASVQKTATLPAAQDDDPAARNVLPGDTQADSQTAAQAEGNNQQQNSGNLSPSSPAQGNYPNPAYSQNGEAPQGQYGQNNYPPQHYPQQQYPQQQYPRQQEPAQGYPPQQQAGAYPLPQLPGGGYGQGGYGQPAPRIYRRDYERQQTLGNAPYGAPQGQPGGQQVTLAPGVVLPVRITRWLSSGDAAPGSTFTAVVENDVLANGLIAIPRGAEVQGTVVDAKGAGALKGRGSLTLQLNSLQLAGRVFPLQSDLFTVTGHDKAAQSVNSTIGGAAIGAIIGAVAGGGAGAAIGAGVGGAAGLGVSAASGGGNAHLPAEALLQFRLTGPTTVVTVSEAEMQRLGNYAGPEGSRRPMPAYGPGYYPYPAPAPYPYVGYYYGRPYRGYYRGYYRY